MTNLLSSGLSTALLAADSSAKAALKPMNMVSRELKKSDPDLELVERAGKYGGNELNRAADALDQAQEELKEARWTARREEKEEAEARLKEKAEEKAAEKKAENVSDRENADNLEKTSAKNRGNAGTQDSGLAADRHNYDTVDISRSPSRTSGSMSAADVVSERPDAGNSVAFPKASSPAAAPNTAFRQKMDLRA